MASVGLSRGDGLSRPRIFVNGEEFDLGRLGAVDKIVAAANEQQLSSLQRDTYYGRLRESDNVLDYLMRRANVEKRVPHQAFAEPSRFVSLHSKEAYALPLGELDGPRRMLW